MCFSLLFQNQLNILTPLPFPVHLRYDYGDGRGDVYIHVKSGRETNVRPRSDVLPDASNHRQWIKAGRASDKKRSSALTWGRWSATSGGRKIAAPQPADAHTNMEGLEDEDEVVAEPRKCGRCGAVTADGCFKFCPECGDVLPDPKCNTRQQADKEAVRDV